VVLQQAPADDVSFDFGGTLRDTLRLSGRRAVHPEAWTTLRTTPQTDQIGSVDADHPQRSEQRVGRGQGQGQGQRRAGKGTYGEASHGGGTVEVFDLDDDLASAVVLGDDSPATSNPARPSSGSRSAATHSD
jgi:hypothetical protein